MAEAASMNILAVGAFRDEEPAGYSLLIGDL